ncbi:MAG: acylphosphatase [Anaerolineales bacterium]
MTSTTEQVRLHIWVTGRVQGVGFRAFVQQTAMLIGVTGWVRNVGAYTVETVAEGEREKVERFAQAVKRGPRLSLVEEAREEWETASGEFATFEVRRNV